MDRRNFLGLFGAGATVAPLVGGVVLRESEARIIEPPKIELVRPEVRPAEDFDARRLIGRPPLVMRVDFYDPRVAEHWQFEAESVVIEATEDPFERTWMGSPLILYGGQRQYQWALRGDLIGVGKYSQT